jgi:hypothetical protein
MSELDKRIVIDQIMFRGAAGFGSSLPQTEIFAKFVAEEISIFIDEFGYSEFTLEEFLLALRINSNGPIKNPSGNDLEQVVFSGICINVFFISKILRNYKVLRDNLDRRIQNIIDGY